MNNYKLILLSSMIFFVLLICGCVFDSLSWMEDLKSEGKAVNIYKCSYQGDDAYYVTSPCCDMYNILFDKNGDKICAPDGGFSGQGDGGCTDFSFSAFDCEIIWEDSDI